MISKHKIIAFVVLIMCFLQNKAYTNDDQSLINNLKEKLSSLTEDTAIVLQKLNIAIQYHQLNADSAYKYIDEAHELALKTNYTAGDAHCHFVRGLINYHAENFKASLKDHLAAYELYSQINDKRNIAASYTNMGIIYAMGIDRQTAIEYYIKSLEITRELNDSLGIAINLNNIGMMYQELKNYDLAAEYFKKTLKIDLDLGNKENIAHSYNNLGKLFLRSKKFDLASANLVTSHELISYVENPDLQIEIFASLGEYYLDTDKPDSALKYIDSALTVAQKFKRKKKQIHNYFLAGRYLMSINKHKPAIFHIKEAIKLADSIGVIENTADYYEYISQAYFNIDDFENAHLNLLLSNSIKDSIQSDQVARSLSNFEKQSELLRVQTEFQVDKQKQQNEVEKGALRLRLVSQFAVLIIIFLITIVLIFIHNSRNKSKVNKSLQEKNEIIEHQSEKLLNTINILEENERKLEDLNATKDKFFSIIAHDLKNPFNVILGYSDLLANEPLIKKDPQKLDKISKLLHNTAEYSYELLENLLTWSRSQTESMKAKKEYFNLAELINSKLSFFKNQATSKNIRICFDLQPELIVYADPNMVFTSLRNLIHNAIKFTEEGGHIDVIATLDCDKVKFSVRDTGIGISLADQKKLFRIDSDFKINGTNNETGTGLGLILSNEFISKNGGELSVESEEGKGSIFTFTLPILVNDE